jgi:hypothetical protein
MDTTSEHAVPGNGHSKKTRTERVKELVAPKIDNARDYLEGHRLVTALIGFAAGFIVGRLLRGR